MVLVVKISIQNRQDTEITKKHKGVLWYWRMGTSARSIPNYRMTRPQQQYSTTLHLLTRMMQALIALIIFIAPFPFGSVQDQWIFSIQIGICLLLLLWIGIQMAAGEVSFIKARLMRPLMALAAYLLLSLLPMPRRLLELFSSETSRLYQAAAKAVSDIGVGVMPVFRITLTPFDTEGELLKFIAYLCFFVLALNVLRYRGGYLAIYQTIIASGAAVAILGIVQNLWSNGLIYWKYDSESGTPFGPFANHNHFAGYMELALGLALGMLAAEIRKLRQKHPVSGLAGYFTWIWQKEGARPWMLSVASFVMLAALTASLSRGGLTSFMVTACLFGTGALLTRRWSPTAPKRAADSHRRWIVLGALALVALFVITMVLSPRIHSRWSSVFDESARYRKSVWNDGLKALSDFPLTGAGLGSYRTIYPRYKSGAFLSESTHAENEYLEWAMETGFLGIVLMSLAVLNFTFQVLSRLNTRRDPYLRSLSYGALFSLTSLGIHNLMDFNTHIPSNALTLTAITALCLVVVNCHRGQHGDRFMMEVSHLPIWSAKAFAVIGSVLLITLLLGRQSWAHYQSLRLEARWTMDKPFIVQGDPNDSQFVLLSDAARWAPWNDHVPYLEATTCESAAAGKGLFQFYDKQRLLEHAQEDILKAIRVRPAEARYWTTLGRIEQDLVKMEVSETAFLQAVRLAKGNGWIQRDYGLFLLSKGEVREAAARFAMARNFAPMLDLRQMLEWMSSRTTDPKVWQSIVRYEPQDLRVYAAFLNNRGLSDVGSQIMREADNLERRLNEKPK